MQDLFFPLFIKEREGLKTYPVISLYFLGDEEFCLTTYASYLLLSFAALDETDTERRQDTRLKETLIKYLEFPVLQNVLGRRLDVDCEVPMIIDLEKAYGIQTRKCEHCKIQMECYVCIRNLVARILCFVGKIS